MELTDEQILDYKRHHNYTRDSFIKEVIMMHEVAIELREKPRLNINMLESTSELQLIKSHKFYWDKL